MLGRVSLEVDIIQRGDLWRIGNGEKINIWQQHWLPRKHPTQLLNCHLESFEDHTVATLFDPITRRWNEELVDGLFVTEDADLIKKIPLSRNAAEDTLYWPYTPSGNYSCKFGYRFLKKEAKLESNLQAPPICEKRLWKKIWQMRALPKVKNFLWRACRNALPTKQALMRRKILEDPTCERCK